jgi:hypothetical protein
MGDGQSVGVGASPIHARPVRSIFSNALNFCRSAIAALVRSPCRYCPFRLPGGPPLPLAPPVCTENWIRLDARQRLGNLAT